MAITTAERRAAAAATPADYRAFQKFIFSAVTRKLHNDRTRLTWHDRRPTRPIVEAFILGDGKRDALSRLQVYNRMYWYRTLDSLAEDFPGVRAVLGKKLFNTVAETYVERVGSTAFTLRHLGRDFPLWLRRRMVPMSPDLALAAADVAEVEWASCMAFEAAAEPPLDPAALANPDTLTLVLQPHVTLLKVNHDVTGFLKKIPATPPTRRKNPRRMPELVAVSRVRERVCADRLEPGEHFLLSLFAKPTPIADAIDAYEQRDDLDISRLHAYFARFAERDWLTTPDPAKHAKNTAREIDLDGPAKGDRAGEITRDSNRL